MTTDDLIDLIESWGRERGIIPNSTPMAQAMKTMSELGELADATLKSDRDGIIDGVGDVVVTLVLYCRLQGIAFQDCIAAAYQTIKDRKGFLNPNGVFEKEPS